MPPFTTHFCVGRWWAIVDGRPDLVDRGRTEAEAVANLRASLERAS